MWFPIIRHTIDLYGTGIRFPREPVPGSRFRRWTNYIMRHILSFMLLENMSFCFGFRSLVIQLVTLEPVSGFPGNRFQGPGSAGRKTSSCYILSFMHLKNVSFWEFPIVWNTIGHFGTGIRVFRRPVPGFGIGHSGVVSDRSTYNWLLGTQCPAGPGTGSGSKGGQITSCDISMAFIWIIISRLFRKICHSVALSNHWDYNWPLCKVEPVFEFPGYRFQGSGFECEQTLSCDISNFVISKEIPF